MALDLELTPLAPEMEEEKEKDTIPTKKAAVAKQVVPKVTVND